LRITILALGLETGLKKFEIGSGKEMMAAWTGGSAGGGKMQMVRRCLGDMWQDLEGDDGRGNVKGALKFWLVQRWMETGHTERGPGWGEGPEMEMP
jgi:hypothetical protein